MATVEWQRDTKPVAYDRAVRLMERRVAEIRAGTNRELVWLLEHPHVYTAGTSACPQDLVDAGDIPVVSTGRGGAFTYHGPGQRVAYAMLDLSRRRRDIRLHVARLQRWLIDVLVGFGIVGEVRPDRIGVWVRRGNREEKIGAIGVRLRHWVSYHGASLNVDPDLSAYRGIVPCGIREHGVTSLAALGVKVSMEEVDATLMKHFAGAFDEVGA